MPDHLSYCDIDATSDAIAVLTTARRKVVEGPHTAWVFLKHAADRLDNELSAYLREPSPALEPDPTDARDR